MGWLVQVGKCRGAPWLLGFCLHRQMSCRAQPALHTLCRLLMFFFLLLLADRCCSIAVPVLVRPSTLLLLLLPCPADAGSKANH